VSPATLAGYALLGNTNALSPAQSNALANAASLTDLATTSNALQSAKLDVTNGTAVGLTIRSAGSVSTVFLTDDDTRTSIRVGGNNFIVGNSLSWPVAADAGMTALYNGAGARMMELRGNGTDYWGDGGTNGILFVDPNTAGRPVYATLDPQNGLNLTTNNLTTTGTNTAGAFVGGGDGLTFSYVDLTGAGYNASKSLSFDGTDTGDSSSQFGYLADGSSYGAALGLSANGSGSGAAVGYNAYGNNNGAAVGYGANGSGYGTAVGYGANGNNFGAALGSSADGHGVGNVALGGNDGSGDNATVPGGFTDTIELGRGTATTSGGLHFRGRLIVDSNYVHYGNGSGVTNVAATNLVNGPIPGAVVTNLSSRLAAPLVADTIAGVRAAPNTGLLPGTSYGYANLNGAVWTNGVATYTVNFGSTGNHYYSNDQQVVIHSITPSGYNTTNRIINILSATKFQVPLASDPGTYVSGGDSQLIPDAYYFASGPRVPTMQLNAHPSSVPLGYDVGVPMFVLAGADANYGNSSWRVGSDGHTVMINHGNNLKFFQNGYVNQMTADNTIGWTTSSTAPPSVSANVDCALYRSAARTIGVSNNLAVIGTNSAAYFAGDGSGLTNLQAANIVGGDLSIPGIIASGTNITAAFAFQNNYEISPDFVMTGDGSGGQFWHGTDDRIGWIGFGGGGEILAGSRSNSKFVFVANDFPYVVVNPETGNTTVGANGSEQDAGYPLAAIGSFAVVDDGFNVSAVITNGLILVNGDVVATNNIYAGGTVTATNGFYGNAVGLTNIQHILFESGYQSNTVATISPGAWNWHLITNDLTLGNVTMPGWTLETNALVFTNSQPAMVHSAITLSYSTSIAATRTVYFRVYKNGSPIVSSLTRDTVTTTDVESTALHPSFMASNGDRFQLYAMVNGTGDITVVDLSWVTFLVK